MNQTFQLVAAGPILPYQVTQILWNISHRHHDGLHHTWSGGGLKTLLASLSHLRDLTTFARTGGTGVCVFAGGLVERLNDGPVTIWPSHDHTPVDLKGFSRLEVLHVPFGCFFDVSIRSQRKSVKKLLPRS